VRIVVSNIIRKLAALIEVDDTPSDEEIKEKRKLPEKAKSNLKVSPGDTKVVVKEETPLKPTKRPDIKPPRRQTEVSKKWNQNSKRELMRDYMRDYRSTGKINQTNGPKNKYVKKLKTAEEDYEKYLVSAQAAGRAFNWLEIPESKSPPHEGSDIKVGNSCFKVIDVATPTDIGKARGGPIASDMRKRGIGWRVKLTEIQGE